MNTCDCCDALLSEAEMAANPRWDQELCDHCAADYSAANTGRPVTNDQRMQVVHAACTVAFDQAHAAWRAGNSAARLFWITVQGACSDELQDCVAASKAGVP